MRHHLHQQSAAANCWLPCIRSQSKVKNEFWIAVALQEVKSLGTYFDYQRIPSCTVQGSKISSTGIARLSALLTRRAGNGRDHCPWE
jgi:hypothetical protein